MPANAIEAATRAASTRNVNALDVLLITSTDSALQYQATYLESLASSQQVPMQTLCVEQLADGSNEEKIAMFKQRLQELHQSGKIDAHTQVIIDLHGSINHEPHHLVGEAGKFLISTHDMVSLIRETGMEETQSPGNSCWQGVIHIFACGAGGASQDLKDGAGMTLLYAGKKVIFSFNSSPILKEMIRQLGEYRKNPEVNKFPSAQEFFSTAGSISGEKVSMVGQGNLFQIRSGYLPHPTELTQTAVLERLQLSLLAKVAHGKPANVQKAIDLLGDTFKNIKVYPPLLVLFDKCASDAEKKIKMLLRAGADINQRFDSGDTLLHLACENCTKERFSLFLQHGADVHALNGEDNSVLGVALENRRVDLIELLIEAGADVNSTTPRGNSALHLAVELRDDQLVEWLLGKGANLHQKNINDESPLSQLLRQKQFDRAMSLLSRADQKNKVADVYEGRVIKNLVLNKYPMLARAIFNLSSTKNALLRELFSGIYVEIYLPLDTDSSPGEFSPDHEKLLSFCIEEMLLLNDRMPDFFINFLCKLRSDDSAACLKYVLNIPGFVEKIADNLPEIRDVYQAAGNIKGCEYIDAALARKSMTTGKVVN